MLFHHISSNLWFEATVAAFSSKPFLRLLSYCRFRRYCRGGDLFDAIVAQSKATLSEEVGSVWAMFDPRRPEALSGII